jgi:hypothetical protein
MSNLTRDDVSCLRLFLPLTSAFGFLFVDKADLARNCGEGQDRVRAREPTEEDRGAQSLASEKSIVEREYREMGPYMGPGWTRGRSGYMQEGGWT